MAIKKLLIILFFLLQYLSYCYSQKINIVATDDTICDIVNINGIIVNNTNNIIRIIPFPYRPWTIDLFHNGHIYREFKEVLCAPYPDTKIKFKKVKKNYKFNFTIDFTKLYMELGYKDFIPDAVYQLDTIFNKYGYNDKVPFNKDYGKYKLIIRYDYFSEIDNLECHLKSDTVEIIYVEKKTVHNTAYKP